MCRTRTGPSCPDEGDESIQSAGWNGIDRDRCAEPRTLGRWYVSSPRLCGENNGRNRRGMTLTQCAKRAIASSAHSALGYLLGLAHRRTQHLTQKEIVMPQVMEMSKLSKLIGTIGRQRVRVETMIQTAAVQCIAQSIEHRNSTPAAQLYEVLGKSNRRDSLVAYFERFGNLAWSKVEDKVVFFDVASLPGRTTLTWSDEYAKKVEGVQWFNAKPEPKVKSVFDVEDAVSKLIESCERAIKKGIEVKNPELYDSVAAVLYAFKADLKSERVAQAAAKQDTPSVEQIIAATGASADEAREALVAAGTVSEEKLAELAQRFGKAEVKAA
jgi:hypothetical protein